MPPAAICSMMRKPSMSGKAESVVPISSSWGGAVFEVDCALAAARVTAGSLRAAAEESGARGGGGGGGEYWGAAGELLGDRNGAPEFCGVAERGVLEGVVPEGAVPDDPGGAGGGAFF